MAYFRPLVNGFENLVNFLKIFINFFFQTMKNMNKLLMISIKLTMISHPFKLAFPFEMAVFSSTFWKMVIFMAKSGISAGKRWKFHGSFFEVHLLQKNLQITKNHVHVQGILTIYPWFLGILTIISSFSFHFHFSISPFYFISYQYIEILLIILKSISNSISIHCYHNFHFQSLKIHHSNH